MLRVSREDVRNQRGGWDQLSSLSLKGKRSNQFLVATRKASATISIELDSVYFLTLMDFDHIRFTCSYKWGKTLSVGHVDFGENTAGVVNEALKYVDHIWVDCLCHLGIAEVKAYVVCEMMAFLYTVPRIVIVPQAFESLGGDTKEMLGRGWVFQEQMINPVFQDVGYSVPFLQQILLLKGGMTARDHPANLESICERAERHQKRHNLKVSDSQQAWASDRRLPLVFTSAGSKATRSAVAGAALLLTSEDTMLRWCAPVGQMLCKAVQYGAFRDEGDRIPALTTQLCRSMSLPTPTDAEELRKLINLLYAEGVERGWGHQVAVGESRVGACNPFAVKGRNPEVINTPWRAILDRQCSVEESRAGGWIQHGPQRGSDGVPLDHFEVWCNDEKKCTVVIRDRRASRDVWRVYREVSNAAVVDAIKSGSAVRGIAHGEDSEST